MESRTSFFGKTKNGEEITLYTLKNTNGLEAGFIDLGAVWVSMLTPDKDGVFEDVVLGYDHVEAYEKNPPHLGAPIGRYANRIAGGKFTLEGTQYQLEVNFGRNSLHSGKNYWHGRVWEAKLSRSELGEKISFFLESPDQDQGFPGNCKVCVSYTLSEDNSLIIEYHMVSDRTTVCNLTNHAYFNLAGHKSGNILNQEVWIDADYFTPADEHSIPTGEIRSVENTPMDFRGMRRIGADIDSDYECIVLGGGYDHNWVINHPEKGLKLIAKARDFESKRLMKVYSDLPGLQFYTGNFLNDAIPGKEGARYTRRSGYCFETQFFPNAINTPSFAQPVIKAGEEFRSFTIYKFDLD